MKRINALWALPLLGMLAMPAMAGNDYDDGYHSNRVEKRLDRQHWQIKEGVRSGELTRKEAKRLRKQNRHIAELEHSFWRDGHLSRYERRTLHSELNAASDRIYRLKHNDRYRDQHHRGHHKPDRHRDYYYYDYGDWSLSS
ncbi:MAG: hypothetical protein GY792_05820 [Gammaproteobacteria bacterium]|nr:hypothetical protein [Gammaproteobacteria bacterium]